MTPPPPALLLSSLRRFAETLQVRIVYVCTIYIARINRRIRPVGDGLVAAMAHLWSKFTKCLRSSKGASDPGPLPSPNVVPPAHNAASFAIITSLLSPPRGSNEILPPFIYRPLFASSALPLLLSCHVQIISLRSSERVKNSSACNEYNVDNKIFPAEIIDLPTMRCVVFYL